VVDQVVKALAARGHTASVLAVHGDLKKLLGGIARRKPDAIFNLMETFGDHELGAVSLAGALELLAVPYTGGGPGELYLQEDKALTKKLLAYEGILFPDFAVFRQDTDLETGGKLRMPLFVKPLRMDASIGIDARAVVRSSEELMKRVSFVHKEVHDAALAEEYIEGREFYVGVLGNQEPLALPPLEMDFSQLPPDKPHIVDAKAKWDNNSIEYKGTRVQLAELADDVAARLKKVAVDAYRALQVRDYGRIDLRLAETGDIHVIEVNASCYLERSAEFATAAAAAGIDYPDLIHRVLELAMQRFAARGDRPAPRHGK
jgi:D-alanine-D-alanine ligase and related ATP-grasp enzymes